MPEPALLHVPEDRPEGVQEGVARRGHSQACLFSHPEERFGIVLHLLNNALFKGDFCLVWVLPTQCTAFAHSLNF